MVIEKILSNKRHIKAVLFLFEVIKVFLNIFMVVGILTGIICITIIAICASASIIYVTYYLFQLHLILGIAWLILVIGGFLALCRARGYLN